MSESEKLKERITNEKNATERAHLKKELDQIPMTSSELEQVVEREEARKTADIEDFHRKRKH